MTDVTAREREIAEDLTRKISMDMTNKAVHVMQMVSDDSRQQVACLLGYILPSMVFTLTAMAGLYATAYTNTDGRKHLEPRLREELKRKVDEALDAVMTDGSTAPIIAEALQTMMQTGDMAHASATLDKLDIALGIKPR